MVPCAVLIPAYNEAATVATIIGVARAADVAEVWLVDDGSSDDTTKIARVAGAQVITLTSNQGKGAAVAAGLAALESEVVVLLDADLVGLTPLHIHQLAHPVLTGVWQMSRGVFSHGRWQTDLSQRLTPILNGQRAIRTQLLHRVPGLAQSRYGLEVLISHHARSQGWRWGDVPLAGVSQIMKEEKHGHWQGIRQRTTMYRQIITMWYRLRQQG